MAWINTDFDFGLPYAVFSFGLRKFKEAGIPEIHDLKDPEKICESLTNLVVLARPDLAGGKVVALDTRNFVFQLAFIHPSFHSIKLAETPAPIYLWRCEVCHCNIPYPGTELCHIVEEEHIKEVCEKCFLDFQRHNVRGPWENKS